MRKLERIEEVHSLEFEILQAFDKFCKCHNFNYSLGAGTLLGAVRHKGFIPWDDDIDLFMLRNDYDRFLKFTAAERLIEDRYLIKSPFDSDMPYPFIKIIDRKTKVVEPGKATELGLWIDIFPVDFCGDTLEAAEKERERNVFFNRFMYRYLSFKAAKKISVKYLLKLALFAFLRCFGIKAGSYFKDKIISKKYLADSKFAGTIVASLTKKDVYPSYYFTEGYENLEFEGQLFPVFKHYEEILSWRYGNFMQLPKVENRHCHLSDVYIEE